jgi:uncharacterized protein
MRKSTRSFLFPDINVWIALTFEGHVHHVVARNWFVAQRGGARFFFCRFTQLGFLRLLTSEAVMGEDEVLSQSGAWRVYDRWIGDDRIEFMEEPSGLDPVFRGLTRLQKPAPKDWADSYLAAFADASQLTLVTFDRAIRQKYAQVRLLQE